MKKILYAIAIVAVAATAFTACKPDNTNTGDKVVKRLTACGDAWSQSAFTWGTDGKVKTVTVTSGDWVETYTFTWSGNVGSAVYNENGEVKESPFVFTMGSNGYLETLANHWGDTWKFFYDSENHLTKITRPDRDNAVKANCVWTSGDLTKWSRVKDGGEEEWKVQTFYTDQENVAGIFADATDKADVSRWVFELGWCGTPSKHLLKQAAWEGSEAIAVNTYKKDADGFVTEVSKVYDGGEPEIYTYTWEVVK